MNTQEIIGEATSLPVEERAIIVDSLLRSLNQPESEIDAQWINIAQKRLLELQTKAVNTIPGEEVFKKIWRRFNQ